MPFADPSTISTSAAERPFFPWIKGIQLYAAVVVGLAYWGLFGLLLTLVGWPLSFLLPKRRAESLGRAVLHRLFGVFVGYLRITGLVKLDWQGLSLFENKPGPLIVAPNHASLWDAVFLIARLPKSVCVMKACILKNPLLGGGAKLAGYIPNSSITRTIRHACRSLEGDGQLLIFPEGTRTHPEARWINPLKGGCAIIASRTRLPIYPVFIRSSSRFLQKGWPIWKIPHFPVVMQFTVGEPIVPAPGESTQRLCERLRAAYEDELAKSHPLRRRID